MFPSDFLICKFFIQNIGAALKTTNRSFRVLLLGETVSAIGSQVTSIAIPLTAVVLLGASPTEVGLLGAAGLVAFAVCGLVSGAVIDRSAKRRVLVFTNIASALALALIPLAHEGRCLSLGLLIGVNFLASGFVAAEEIARMSAMPLVVARDAIGPANAQFSAVMSIATTVGPAVAAALIALLSAPGAVAVDSLSFAGAAALMLMLPKLSVAIPDASRRPTVKVLLTEGLSTIAADPLIRSVLGLLVLSRCLGAMCLALEAVFVVRQLGVPPSWFALAFAVGGGGALIGSMASRVVVARTTLPALLGGALVVAAVARGAMSMLHGAPLMVGIGFAFCLLVLGGVGALIRVAVLSALQSRVQPAMMGRVFGTLSTIMGIVMPLGALAGGVLGTALGIRPTLMLASLSYLILALVIVVNTFIGRFNVTAITAKTESAD